MLCAAMFSRPEVIRKRPLLYTPYREVALFANVCASGTESRVDRYQRTRYKFSIVMQEIVSGVEHGEATHEW